MGKIAKRAPSIRSRAARREDPMHKTSAKLVGDTSSTTTTTADESAHEATDRGVRPSVLALHRSAGISRKEKHGRKTQLSARAKKRKERSAVRAEAIHDVTTKKVERSVQQGKTVQARRQTWDTVNRQAARQKKKALAQNPFALLLEDADDVDNNHHTKAANAFAGMPDGVEEPEEGLATAAAKSTATTVEDVDGDVALDGPTDAAQTVSTAQPQPPSARALAAQEADDDEKIL